MAFLGMLIIGLVVGALARFITPGRDPVGCIMTMLLGIAGSLVAGYLGHQMGWYAEGQPAGFLASIGGAVLLLLIYRMAVGKK